MSADITSPAFTPPDTYTNRYTPIHSRIELTLFLVLDLLLWLVPASTELILPSLLNLSDSLCSSSVCNTRLSSEIYFHVIVKCAHTKFLFWLFISSLGLQTFRWIRNSFFLSRMRENIQALILRISFQLTTAFFCSTEKLHTSLQLLSIRTHTNGFEFK